MDKDKIVTLLKCDIVISAISAIMIGITATLILGAVLSVVAVVVAFLN